MDQILLMKMTISVCDAQKNLFSVLIAILFNLRIEDKQTKSLNPFRKELFDPDSDKLKWKLQNRYP